MPDYKKFDSNEAIRTDNMYNQAYSTPKNSGILGVPNTEANTISGEIQYSKELQPQPQAMKSSGNVKVKSDISPPDVTK